MALTKWTIAAALLGAALYTGILHRFLDYSSREQAMEDGGGVTFAVAILLAGALLAWRAVGQEWSAGLGAMAGVLVAHIIAIAVDLQEDPTNHNLLPFEMVAFALLASPAMIGAAAVKMVRRVRAR